MNALQDLEQWYTIFLKCIRFQRYRVQSWEVKNKSKLKVAFLSPARFHNLHVIVEDTKGLFKVNQLPLKFT